MTIKIGDKVLFITSNQLVNATVLKIGKTIFGHKKFLVTYKSDIYNGGEYHYTRRQAEWTGENKLVPESLIQQSMNAQGEGK